MEYILKNGRTVIIREPTPNDAEGIIRVISTADGETRFLAREPGEFTTGVEREVAIISGVLADPDNSWFVAEYDGQVVGQCSVGLIRRNHRYRHRAEVAFVLLQKYWSIGIGSAMMQECLKWCSDHSVTQVELHVVSNNERAIAMYKRFGFEITGNTPNALRYADGSYADEYRMIKFM